MYPLPTRRSRLFLPHAAPNMPRCASVSGWPLASPSRRIWQASEEVISSEGCALVISISPSPRPWSMSAWTRALCRFHSAFALPNGQASPLEQAEQPQDLRVTSRLLICCCFGIGHHPVKQPPDSLVDLIAHVPRMHFSIRLLMWPCSLSAMSRHSHILSWQSRHQSFSSAGADLYHLGCTVANGLLGTPTQLPSVSSHRRKSYPPMSPWCWCALTRSLRCASIGTNATEVALTNPRSTLPLRKAASGSTMSHQHHCCIRFSSGKQHSRPSGDIALPTGICHSWCPKNHTGFLW